MADIIRISDRLNLARRTVSTGVFKAEILFFTGIRYERLDPNAIWPRVELPTLPALPAPQGPVFGPDRRPF
ncbi:MAG: hypothetical protein QE484_05155 [Rhizobium sp.]|nr:hypothetical protein [Rhizobium sp.]